MKYFVFLVLLLGLSSCDKYNDLDVPKCIVKELKKNKREGLEYTQVWRWKADGKTYYYLSRPESCYDCFNLLYDDNCNQICAPDGGITGKGSGDCPSFDTGVEKVLVWQKK